MNTILHFEERNKKILNILFFLVLGLGISLRFYQYLMGRSLWEDEAHLALNFITRDYAGLFKPLDYAQTAPPLFLVTVKTFTLIGGNNDYAIRALPFLSSLLTLPFFYYILLSLTKSKIAALTGFLPYAVNIAVIYYSSELKPYELDVAVYLLLIYLAVSNHPLVAARRTFWLTIAGCICLLYSNVAFIILLCIASYIVLKWIQSRKINKGEVFMIAAWTIVFIAYFFLFVYQNPYGPQQRQYWSFAFPPQQLFSPAFIAFLKNSVHEIGFTYLLYVSESYYFAYVLLLLIIIAIAHALYKKQYQLLLFTCLPILIHFALSYLKIYPFWYRLILYIIPPLMVLMAYGAFVTAGFIFRRLHPSIGILFILGCSYFFTVESFKQYPLYYREIKPSLDLINKDYPKSKVYITTPYTLYKYYNLTGYARNNNFEGLDWYNRAMPPETYYTAVEGTTANYILLHAQDYGVDSFYKVMEDLKKRNLIVKEFSYETYTVTEVKPSATDSTLLLVDYSYFPPGKTFDLDGKKVAVIWDVDVTSNPIPLAAGKYKMTVVSKGTPALGVFPHLNILINENKLMDFSTTADYSSTEFYYDQKTDGNIIVKIIMDNDAVDNVKKEDRNAFIYSIRINKER